MADCLIRTANAADAAFVHDVYGYYVQNTIINFSTDNPDVESYREKIEHTLETYPYYICEAEGKPCGFAYAGPIRPHEAYRWNVEATIYLAPDAPRRTGLGKTLYLKLLDTLKQQGFKAAYGVITDNNEPSLSLHRALGFVQACHFNNMGYKNGAWYGVIWMQKALGTFAEKPAEPVPYRLWRTKHGE